MNQKYGTLFDFTGKTVVVTGAAGGLGSELCRAFAELGASLVLVDIDNQGLDSLAASLGGRANGTLKVVTDVSRQEDVDAMVQAAMSRTGRIDVLVHCAGIGGRSPAHAYPMELWDRVMEVNPGGTFLCAQAVGRVMLSQGGGGSIVIVSSVGGVVGKPGSVAYQVGKAMEIQLAKSLGVEWAQEGVRVNALAPGLFLTDAIEAELKVEPTLNDVFMKNLPQKRAGDVREFVGAALFLASDASTYVTGAVLPVDGGVLAA